MFSIFQPAQHYTRPTKRRLFALLIVLLVISLIFFSGCKRGVDYFTYVSELRANVFLGENDTFRVRVYAIQKESPYVTDGIPCEKNVRTEIYLSAPNGAQDCHIAFSIDGVTYGGEASYDNVKGEYFYACPLNTEKLSVLSFQITYGNQTVSLTANSVRTAETLSPNDALRIVVDSERELFQAMTDKYGFAGEIYMRLIFEDAPFYYVGVIDRNGSVTAFLLNATTGRILAKRNP